MLFAVAFADTLAYLENGSMTLYDIQEGVKMSQGGIVCLNFYHKVHGLINSYGNDDLLNLVMQIEAMIFNVDMKVGYRDLVDMVISEKKVISDAINKTLEQGTHSEYYPSLYPVYSAWIRELSIQETILAYGTY